MKIFIWLVLFTFWHGASGVNTEMSVMEGDEVTLNTDMMKTQEDRIKWYFNGNRIAVIHGNQSKICSDDQCKERFRDRLKLDHQTGSLTIMNIRNTDEGVYHLEFVSRKIEKIFNVTVRGSLGAEKDEGSVSAMEGDLVALNTDIIKTQQDRIKWYFNGNRIAEIIGNQSKICADDSCKERFSDRLNLDHQTVSLIIMNITITDSGVYQLQLISSKSEKIFNVVVLGVSAAEREEMKRKSVKEGDSVTLNPGVTKKTKDVMKWYFNEILITEITGDQSKICTDDQCDERFRNRLKLDHQTGSLNIMNTTITDSGEYKLQINNIRFTIIRIFSVSVTGSGLSAAALGGIIAAAVVLLLVCAMIAVIYCLRRDTSSRDDTREQSTDKGDDVPDSNQNTSNGMSQNAKNLQMITIRETPPNETERLLMDSSSGMSHNKNDPPSTNTINGTSHNEKDIPFIDADVP